MYGVVYSALAGVYNKINTMSAIVSNSFTTAGSAMVGQNLGAKKNHRVVAVLKTVTVCSVVVCAVLSAAMLLFPMDIFAAFTSDVQVLSVAGILILPIIINFVGSASRSVSFSLINGSGNTKLNLAIALIDGIFARIGISALLGFALQMGCLGFWYGDALAGFVPIVIGICFFISGKWKAKDYE